MLPPDGSVKDGRTFVYLQRIAPSGGMNENSGDAKKGAGGSADGGAAAAGDANSSGSNFKAGDAKKVDKPNDKKAKTTKPGKQRPKLTTKPLLPASKAAAAKDQAATMIAAAEDGAAFCEDCAEHQRLIEEASRLA